MHLKCKSFCIAVAICDRHDDRDIVLLVLIAIERMPCLTLICLSPVVVSSLTSIKSMASKSFIGCEETVQSQLSHFDSISLPEACGLAVEVTYHDSFAQ